MDAMQAIPNANSEIWLGVIFTLSNILEILIEMGRLIRLAINPSLGLFRLLIIAK